MNVLLRTRQVLPLMLATLVSLLGLVGGGLGVAHAAPPVIITSCPTEAMLITDIGLAGPGGTVRFSISSPCTIPISPPLTIAQNLTLDNQGQQVTLDGGGTTQVLSVNSGVTFTLNAITIAHGLAPSSNPLGGGLYNNGTVTITNSTFTNNSARVGGGLYSAGTVTISNSTFASNSAGFGGGLYNDGTVSISNSTFTNDTATANGGGLNDDRGMVTISNSTFANDTASFGGGLYNFASSGTITITNSTIANNTASTSQGGGLNNNDGGTASITQSIVANNTGGDCHGTITDGGYNLSSDASCGFTTASHDLSNTNPQLAAGLANNGGPTQTIALLSSSPAIDFIPVGSSSLGLCFLHSSDQRGFPRPDNGESVCDIGAFELQDPPAPPPPSSPSSPAPACQISTTKPGTFCLNQGGNFATTDIS